MDQINWKVFLANVLLGSGIFFGWTYLFETAHWADGVLGMITLALSGFVFNKWVFK